VQGDTSSAFAAALAAFYLQIPVAHVEAGLRSYDRFQPFPEELNRRFISTMADLNFCPTDRAAENLRAERIDPSSIYITGNTGIDALLAAVELVESEPDRPAFRLEGAALPPGRMILVTGHRRENFGKGLSELALSMVDLVRKYPDVTVVYSAHPNPRVRQSIGEILAGHDRIVVIPPPDYFRFVALMKDCYFIVTDSGGIQEEAPSLKKPALVARQVTERPEAVEAGTAILVGNDRERIVAEASRLLDDPQHYAAMTAKENPFGDGRASRRIADRVEEFLQRRGASCAMESK
jgi:UDP-N-acetylglucosamine 2-epimerase (non-hydrolysing)